MPGIFQLTVLSQADPQCSAGSNLSVVVNPPVGGTLTANSSPVGTSVPLPTPAGTPNYAPPPNWFLQLSDEIDTACFTLTISGPSAQTTTMIAVPGAMMSEWVAASQPGSTNQKWLEAACGIFGYAQYNTDADQWIYTVTAGVNWPKLHPPR